MDKNSPDRYRIALQWVQYEGGLLWQIFGAFLLPHTIFLAFLLQAVLGADLPADQPGCFWPSVIGLVLCIPWWAAYNRNSAYYKFRLAQAKDTEPEGWELLNGPVERFADGHEVTVGGGTLRHKGISRLLNTRRSVTLMIAIFAVVYFGIAILSSSYW